MAYVCNKKCKYFHEGDFSLEKCPMRNSKECMKQSTVQSKLERENEVVEDEDVEDEVER